MVTYSAWDIATGNFFSALWYLSHQARGNRRVESQGLVQHGKHVRQFADRIYVNLVGTLECRPDFMVELLEDIWMGEQEISCSG